MSLFRPDLSPEARKRADEWLELNDRPPVIEFREVDGEARLVGEAWPLRMLVADHLLDLVRPGFITTGDGMLRVTVANADGLYGWEGDGPTPGSSWYRLIRGTVA